jgi:hypothetical protein
MADQAGNKELPINDEKFSRAMLKTNSGKEAYQEVFPNCTPESAHSNAHRMMAKEGVKERIKELMREQGLSETALLTRLNHWKDSDEHPAVSLDATKTGLKIMGAFDDESSSSNKDLRIEIAIVPNTVASSITLEHKQSSATVELNT